jgi:hypothetical protein
MLTQYVAAFREPLPASVQTHVVPDGSVHYAVDGRHYFAGFVGPEGVIYL